MQRCTVCMELHLRSQLLGYVACLAEAGLDSTDELSRTEGLFF